jgi:hypothetical protein
MSSLTALVLAASVVAAPDAASAACLTKAAEATAGTAESAKWFALETMVQSVSWGLWPSFLQDGSTPGWKITSQSYNCSSSGGGVTCRGNATFCKTGG